LTLCKLVCVDCRLVGDTTGVGLLLGGLMVRRKVIA